MAHTKVPDIAVLSIKRVIGHALPEPLTIERLTSILAVLGNMTAWVGTIGTVAPHLDHVEHLAQASQSAVGRNADMRLVPHQRSDIRARHVG